MSRTRFRRGVWPTVAAVVAAGVLGGCQKVVRPSVGASVSPCFRILPQAHQALDGQGAFVDVARIRGRGVTLFPRGSRPGPSGAVTTSGASGDTGPGSSSPASPTGPSTTLAGTTRDICVVAYRGTFDTSRIQHLILGHTGQYALVIVGVRAQQVRGVVLIDRLPPPLHAH